MKEGVININKTINVSLFIYANYSLYTLLIAANIYIYIYILKRLERRLKFKLKFFFIQKLPFNPLYTPKASKTQWGYMCACIQSLRQKLAGKHWLF
jgi:hypothetical protein